LIYALNYLFFRFVRVEVGEMEKINHDFIMGTLHKDSSGKFIACTGGKIYDKFR